MSNVYSLRIYDTELMRFTMEKRGLEGLVAEVVTVNQEYEHLMPLDLTPIGEGIIKWLEHRLIPRSLCGCDSQNPGAEPQ